MPARLAVNEKIWLFARHILEENEMTAVVEVIDKYKRDKLEGIKAFNQLDRLLFIPSKDPMLNQQKEGFVDILSLTPTEESWAPVQKALIYCRKFVSYTNLVQTSRDFVRRSSDYVENCAKYLLSSLDPKASLKYPLGNIVNSLKRKDFNLPTDLIDQIEAFNREIYTEAKHRYDLPPDQHLYSPDEAFVIYFAAKKIGCKIRELVVLQK